MSGSANGAPLDGMVNLIEQIESSRYANGIYGETSMCDLCITQLPLSDRVAS
jgi:hypothetical protein